MNVRTKGRKLSPLELEILGPIEPTDLLEREAERQLPSSETPTVAKLRSVHHEIAQLLASGMSETDVAAVTAYSLSRISVLKADPSFRDLVQFYREKKTAAFADVQKRLATLSLDAVGELQERLAEKPESISNSQLIELAKVSLDRAGFSPVAKTQNVNVNISKEELDELRAAAHRGVEVVTTLTPDTAPGWEPGGNASVEEPQPVPTPTPAPSASALRLEAALGTLNVEASDGTSH